MKEKLIIATNNAHKLEEFKDLFPDNEVLSLKEIGFNEEIEENGTTFLENSLIKAKTISEFLKDKGILVPVLADDSGLCVNALNGEPGLYSARYTGKHGDIIGSRKKLLDKLKGEKDRSAYYICSLVKYFPNGTYIHGEGKVFGKILEEQDGDSGFAFDCLFFCDELNKCFGRATDEEKNSVSHRFRAIIDLKNKEKLKC